MKNSFLVDVIVVLVYIGLLGFIVFDLGRMSASKECPAQEVLACLAR